jgi:hypothetical protein
LFHPTLESPSYRAGICRGYFFVGKPVINPTTSNSVSIKDAICYQQDDIEHHYYEPEQINPSFSDRWKARHLGSLMAGVALGAGESSGHRWKKQESRDFLTKNLYS